MNAQYATRRMAFKHRFKGLVVAGAWGVVLTNAKRRIEHERTEKEDTRPPRGHEGTRALFI